MAHDVGLTTQGKASSKQLTDACADISPGVELLAMAYPEFTISEPRPGRNGPTWTAIRRDPAQPGLYAAVTPDLTELRDTLACHAIHETDAWKPMPPPPLDPESACYRNPGSPADQALTSIVAILADAGYNFSIPSWDGHAYLRISNAVQAITDLTITSHGEIAWEYRSSRYPHDSPGRLITIAIELLDPDHTRPAPAVPPAHLKLTPLGDVRHALAKYGLAATISPTGPDTGLLLTAANPRLPGRGRIFISDDGELQWNTRAPHHPDGGIPLPDVASTITRALDQARHPATRADEQPPCLRAAGIQPTAVAAAQPLIH